MTQSCVDCHVEPAISIGSGKRCPECWALAYVDLYGDEMSHVAVAVWRVSAGSGAVSKWDGAMEAIARLLRARIKA